jgi:hypothetical protein
MLLKVVRSGGSQRVFALMPIGVNQMNVQQAANLPVEVHLASLDAWSKESARVHIENPSPQSPTIRLNETSNVNAVTDFHLCHGPHSSRKISVGNQRLSTPDWCGTKNFLAFTWFYDLLSYSTV